MTEHLTNGSATTVPDVAGRFGIYGGRFVPEALMAALEELDAAYRAAIIDPDFTAEFEYLQRTYTGRPNPVTDATNLRAHAT